VRYLRIFIFASICVLPAILNNSRVYAKIKLPEIFKDNMVLQRNIEVPVWGWASNGETIKLTFNGQKVKTKSNIKGRWLINLKPMQAGGPYVMVIEGEDTVKIKNILVGDVWICSGQSNMEMPVKGWPPECPIKNSDKEIKEANYPEIRFFIVPQDMDTKVKDDIDGGKWIEAVKDNIAPFSAVGYFFSRNIFNEIKVPIGLIGAYWGGSVIETWISGEALKRGTDFESVVKEMEDKSLTVERIKKNIDEKFNKWIDELTKRDSGFRNSEPIWAQNDTDISDWKEMELPEFWGNVKDTKLINFNGAVWFKKEVNLLNVYEGMDLILELGRISDRDETFFNGVKIGETNHNWTERFYKIPGDIVKAGRNVITVRISYTSNWGSIIGDPGDFCLRPKEGYAFIPIKGIWKYKIGAESIGKKPLGRFDKNSMPTLLYNAMIAPLTPYRIKGVIWYQGEGNTGRAYQYRSLFPLLINDWRAHWDQGDFPFLFVQLANYGQVVREPGESPWAELREAQTVALSLPNTGMAVTIDIGEAFNVHPKNKQDVGKRLALAALKVAYNKDLVYSGPMYESMSIEGDKIRVRFNNTGSGLTAKDRYGYLKGFAIAGEDKKFEWAKAIIVPDEFGILNTIEVYSDRVKNPVAVRYGWADNPDDANLYNLEGLPASPFRTDTWRGCTFGKSK
jgi:sialate O-acetylesterase